MVYEARYLARNCELKTRLGDIVSHLRHLSHLSQDKTKLLFSFFLILFNYAIQGKFMAWLVNSALNCTWKPISHSSLRDSCDIGFRVQFNAEFPRQVMDFPIKWRCTRIINLGTSVIRSLQNNNVKWPNFARFRKREPWLQTPRSFIWNWCFLYNPAILKFGIHISPSAVLGVAVFITYIAD